MSDDDELRMEAYYYGFGVTGAREIDLILSAVACAGKVFHHTEDWTEDCTCPGHEGATPVEWVQNAAAAAAATIAHLRAQLAAERESNEKLRAQNHADGNEIGSLILKVGNAETALAAERRALEFQKALTVGAISEADAMRNELSAISARHERALIRGAKLREALEFYANPENCKPALTSRVGAFTGIARAVLAETGGGNE